MATPIWQPGTIYIPGSLVQPATAIETVPTSLDNPGFESGTLTGWDVTVSDPMVTTPQVTNYGPHSGTYNLSFDCGAGAPLVTVRGLNQEQPPCDPGTSITATIWLKFSQTGSSGGRAIIAFFDAGNVQIGTDSLGVEYKKPGNTSERWYQSTVSAVAPPGTDSVRIGFVGFLQSDADIRFDDLAWNYSDSPPVRGLIYRAVQPDAGTSDNVEPTWPTTLGVTVVDNTVTWEAVQANRVTWQASPIMESGAVEPTFPTNIGERVTDNNISWEAVSRRIEDENCPNTKVVLIIASHVFAEDDDLVRFCAAANPKDWTTERNAGYLPTGLQQANASGIKVLAQYRGDITAFNASVFQNWQADPDPALMVLKDQLPGIGSVWQQAAQPVANDLFFLAALGVRSVGISGGSTHLSAGDVGEPVDALVRPAIAQAITNGEHPRSAFWPGAGQYWLSFRQYPASVLGIFGDLQFAAVGYPLPPFSYGASGGIGPYTYSLINGTSLPPGLTLTANGAITGTPTQAGMFTWDVQVMDAVGDTDWLTDTVEVIISMMTLTGVLPDTTVGSDYSEPLTITGASGAVIVVSASGTNIPAGTTYQVVGSQLIVAWDDTPFATPITFTEIKIRDSLGVEATWTGSLAVSYPPMGIVRWDAATETGGALTLVDDSTSVYSTTNTAGFIRADTSVDAGDWYWETTTGWIISAGSLINHWGQCGLVRTSDSASGVVIARIGATLDGGSASPGNVLFLAQTMYPNWIPPTGTPQKVRLRNRLTFVAGEAKWQVAIEGGIWFDVMVAQSGEFTPYATSRGSVSDGVLQPRVVNLYSRPEDFLYAIPDGSFPLALAAPP